MSDKALVLSSGGIDSTTCIGIAIERYGKENVVTASVFYGQRHVKELECALNVAEHYGIPHYDVDLSTVLQFSNCNLLAKNEDTIPDKSYAEQIAESGEGRVSTYVPFRNGLMLSSATALADSLFPGETVALVYGAHADDAAGAAYADTSPQFNDAMAKAINIGTYGNIGLIAPLIEMNKAQVVAEGIRLDVPYELTWSCYRGGDLQCGTCATCVDRQKAFDANNKVDPVGYIKEGVVKGE